LGVGENVSKVILPPDAVDVRDKNAAAFEHGLRQMRDGARGLVKELASASAVAGLPVWGLAVASREAP
jgi:hypothetical protein